MTKKKDKKEIQNGEDKPQKFEEVTEEQFQEVADKKASGETLDPQDLDVVLKWEAQKMKSSVASTGEKSPIEYVAEYLGLDKPAINSYFYTSYGVFQKDIESKVNPYVAYTISIIHALNLGYVLGKVEGASNGGEEETDSTN